MSKIPRKELKKLEHIDVENLGARELHMLPVWDGQDWHLWTPNSDGFLMELKIVNVAHSTYLTREKVADESDLYLSFLNFTRQYLCYADINGFIRAVEDDFHLLAVTVAKLDHFFQTREVVDQGLLSSFVRSEIEAIFVISRSVFDLI